MIFVVTINSPLNKNIILNQQKQKNKITSQAGFFFGSAKFCHSDKQSPPPPTPGWHFKGPPPMGRLFLLPPKLVPGATVTEESRPPSSD